MRVLVTGGAGFIGSHLTDAFHDRGDVVAVADDLSAGSLARMTDDVPLHVVSVTDADRLGALLEEFRPALVCHLAAQVDAHDPEVSIAGTVNVLDAARRVGARVLLCSSGSAQSADQDNRLPGTSHAILRLANVYGPRQDPTGEGGVVGIFCSRVAKGARPVIYGDGKQTRDFVYVGDVVSAFVAAADSGAQGTWNIGTGIETSILDLAAVVGEIAGSAIEPEFAPARLGELERSGLDVALAKRDLGWTAATSLRSGVAAVYRWVESGGPWRARS